METSRTGVGVDPVWWTPLKLIFEVSDAWCPATEPLIRRSSGDRWSIECDLDARPKSRRVSSSRPPVAQYAVFLHDRRQHFRTALDAGLDVVFCVGLMV